MVVVGLDVIVDARRRNPRIGPALGRWLKVMGGCAAKSPPDLRRTFGDVDFVRRLAVFDIKGNHFRLIADIDFDAQAVQVHFVLDHSEYERGKWKR